MQDELHHHALTVLDPRLKFGDVCISRTRSSWVCSVPMFSLNLNWNQHILTQNADRTLIFISCVSSMSMCQLVYGSVIGRCVDWRTHMAMDRSHLRKGQRMLCQLCYVWEPTFPELPTNRIKLRRAVDKTSRRSSPIFDETKRNGCNWFLPAIAHVLLNFLNINL